MRIAPFLAGFRNRSTSAALAVAAAVMLVLANLFPVLATETSGSNRTDTIFSGAMELGHQGLWPIAAIVFSASILIPVLKLAGLAGLLLGPHGGARAHSRKFTRIYAAIDFIGRWSMLDVFLAAFLVGLVRFGEMATVEPRGGIVAFAAAVVLTVLATEAFDPREIWRTQENESLQ
ncbi:MAG TPA: paraquat-inducible protein A [Opitutaceae bacterium]|nr:paraquat-inducible protein A [Opitutaceae bacterium]